MDSRITALSRYRFSKAEEDIVAAEVLLDQSIYKSSINRSYYAIFHAMRAITALDEFDSSKHSGVIAFFNQNYVKTEIFDKNASKIIKGASLLREKSDYVDFYIASKQEAVDQLNSAKGFLIMIKTYLEKNGVL